MNTDKWRSEALSKRIVGLCSVFKQYKMARNDVIQILLDFLFEIFKIIRYSNEQKSLFEIHLSCGRV